MKRIKYTQTLLIFVILKIILSQYYPEDYSTIEQLTNIKNIDNDAYDGYDEIFIASYYHPRDSTQTKQYDSRNGILIEPESLSSQTGGDCLVLPTYSKNDDEIWLYSDTNRIFFPSTLDLTSYNCINNNNNNMIYVNLFHFINSYTSINTYYELSHIFYFWIQNKIASNTIKFTCQGSTTPYLEFVLNEKGVYQVYIKYNTVSEKFSNLDGTGAPFSCDSSKEIQITASKSGDTISLRRMKHTILVSKERFSNSNANCNSEKKCPNSYYCDVNLGKCLKCLGYYAKCDNRNIGIKCGRFTKDWAAPETMQYRCDPEYFNLQNLGEMSFDITPPIKSNAASLSFWLFTLTNKDYKLAEERQIKLNHISLEDFFVVTIVPKKDSYTIYLTAYQMYHKAYGTDIQKTKTFGEFYDAISDNRYPYSNWVINVDVNKINRWVNIIVSFNKNSPRITMQIFYQKSNNVGSLDNKEKSTDLKGEYVYSEGSMRTFTSKLHYKKFYRNTDIMHLNINIYNNDIGVYIRKIYTFATELVSETYDSTKLFGFQHIEFENIFPSSNYLMPELILAIPFDKISITNDNKISIEYYMYDMTKIDSNKITKNTIINPGDIQDSLYDYDPRLYRLVLFKEKNKKYDKPYLTMTDISCNNDGINCYNSKGNSIYSYACKTSYYINPVQRSCESINSTNGAKILVPGINANTNKKGTITDVCYKIGNVGGCDFFSITEYQCLSTSFKLFDACISGSYSQDTIGYFYYSYFFQLPPIKINLQKIYKSYYIQFNFLYETNSALRPKENLKGKKLYIFYTNEFKIWHDYSMKYLGIEDKYNNPSKNLIPNFNTENENLFTISVTCEKTDETKVYKGKIFLNGVKIYMPSFTGGELSYILFCHNDTACPLGNEVYWTSGFYNQIRIYDLDDINDNTLNDNSFYSQYIYHNYYSYYNYNNGGDRFDSYPIPSSKGEEIKMNLGSFTYNKIGNYEIYGYYSNEDKLQMFNVGIDQTIPLSGTFDESFINNVFEPDVCQNSLTCYGESNEFSGKAKVCDDTKYYKYDTCEAFPTYKNKYYSLTFPIKGMPTNYKSYSISSEINFGTGISDNDVGKITYTFWLKLIGFKEENKIFQAGQLAPGKDICYLKYEEVNKLLLACQKEGSSTFYYKNYYTIKKVEYGKYMHISIAISLHKYSSYKNFFISFQVNNKNVKPEVNEYDSLANLIDIRIFTLYTQFYGQITKFYIYDEVLIGGYAYHTNTDFSPLKIIDDSRKDCFFDGTIYNANYICINDYDLALNDNYYISTELSSENLVYLPKNNQVKYKKCHEKCDTLCYGTEESECACKTRGFYYYILNSNNENVYECRKLPSNDFKRYKQIDFSINPSLYFVGIDFWFYATLGANTLPTDSLFNIKCGTTSLVEIYSDKVKCFTNTENLPESTDKWLHVFCSPDYISVTDINSPDSSTPSLTSTCNGDLHFINAEYPSASPGIMLIRQFKFWKTIEKRTEIEFTEYKSDNIPNNIYLVIDSLMTNPLNPFYSFKSDDITSISVNPTDYETIEPYFGYTPTTKQIPELELCSETEECQEILNLQALGNLEFNNTRPSGTGRYTMELWIKIKNVKKFMHGINSIWKDLMAISILTDGLKGKLSLYCFPQDYLTSPLGKTGRNIIDSAESYWDYRNIYIFDLNIDDYDNVWFYTRCAYNWDNDIYYFKYNKNNENVWSSEKHIVKEKTSDMTQTDYPFKYLFNEYVTHYFYIENAHLNSDCEIYIRNLYLFNEYLPKEYDTQRVKFSVTNNVLWLIYAIDFLGNTEKVGTNKVKLAFYRKKINNDNNILSIREFTYSDGAKLESRGGKILCDPKPNQSYDINKNLCVISTTSPSSTSDNSVQFGDEYLQCKPGEFLTIGLTNPCSPKCSDGFNRGPGSLIDMDFAKTALCNYDLTNTHHEYYEPDKFPEKLICKDDSDHYVRVGYKCLQANGQEKAALYFNRCYNFYPVFAYFNTIKNKIIDGYILEISFKIDLVNEFCSKEEERFIFFAHPHSIFQNENDTFFYRDTNNLNSKDYDQILDTISSTEWNHIMFEFRPKDLLINIYINYNMTPAYSYNIENVDKYYIKNLLFCNGDQLCSPINDNKIQWGSAYYSKMRIYDLKHSSVYMVYENMRKKFNYNPDSIVVDYLFNTINNDLNVFKDTASNINLDFNGNRPFESIYNTDDKTLLFSTSSTFDFGENILGFYTTSVTPNTGEHTYLQCYGGCERCYSGKQNDCYECIKTNDYEYELYNNECRRASGYYFQLPNIEREIEVNTGSHLTLNNPITVTLWIKYHGKIKGANTNNGGGTCVQLIKISTENNVFICHEQKYNTLLVKRNNIILYNDTLFLENLGKWQLLSISNYKCAFNIKNTCNYYPSMFSVAIDGQVLSRRDSYDIPYEGITVNKISFSYGIIMIISDLQIYNTFILNPLGIISNFASHNKFLVSSFYFHSDDKNHCINKTTILLDNIGRDMYNQQIGNCKSDYNIYHKLKDCGSEDKMININSLENECLDCIDECTHCAGDSKFNCACYYNETYWFRNDNIKNKLFCQLVPYIDLNKYSNIQFNEIKYATSNEFAIEFWYFIYEYNENEINFYRQVIYWENHIKIEFSKYSNDFINVECFPIGERDESVSTNDISQRYFRWNHIICATDLNKKIYYLNELPVNNIIGDAVKQLNYSTYQNRRVILRFQSYNNFDDSTSDGVFLLKELRLWNFFSIREFNTKCYYNYVWAKDNDIPNILHYFPFNMKKDGIIQDSKGNIPYQKILKTNIIGYNIIDYDNKYDIDETFEECLIIYTIPEKVYFNLTNVLIYEIGRKTFPDYTYKFEYYISQNAKYLHNAITKTTLNTVNNPRELLLKKFKDNKYDGVQLNIYVTLTHLGIEKQGFNIIKINSYYPGYVIDFETECRGLYDNLDVDSNYKYSFSDVEIWNRLYLLQSLGDFHIMTLNESNRTTSFLDYKYDKETVSYYPDNIIVKNPICYNNYCSGKGKCLIIVRSMICLCDEGFSGRNCHITNNNKRYLSVAHLKLWNYLTNNNNFSSLSIDNNLLYEITYLVKSSTSFDDSYNDLIKNFFDFLDHLKKNNLNLILDEMKLIFDTISYISINTYYDIQQFRAKNYGTTNKNAEYKNNETIGEVNLNDDQINAIYDISYKITQFIPDIILSFIKLNNKEMFENYTAFDYTIKSVSRSFDYMEYFNNLHINNRNKFNSYLPFIDAFKCADYIFGSTVYNNIFLVIINYHYDPLSFQSIYSYSASYSIDAFYSTLIGTKLDIKACPHYIDIYFPLTLYNESEIKFINSHAKFLSENTSYTVDDPYITWPVFVHKNGSVSNKSRYERINEVLPMLKINCSYYSDKLKLLSNISETVVSETFYLICQTHHLSLYTIQSEKSGFDYKLAWIFFYIEAPQVFICGSNWGNGCTILLILSLLLFAFFIILFKILEKNLMITKNNLNNIKLEILKQNRLIFDEIDLIEEISKANKMNEQDNMAKNLKVETDDDKVDKDLQQNLYLYGTKDINYNDIAFEGGDKGDELEGGYGGKGVFSNPPKKKSGFIIDDIDDIDMSSEDGKNNEEKETRIKKSVNIVKSKKKNIQKNTIKSKPKIEDTTAKNKKKEDMRFYRVREYNPDKTNQVNNYNYNAYKESEFGFLDGDGGESSEGKKSKEKKFSVSLGYKDSSLRESTDELKSELRKPKKKKKKEEISEKKKKNEEDTKNNGKKNNEINTIEYNDDESDKNDNLDYFSKYKGVIKNENKKSGKKVIIKKGNYTIVDKYRKVNFVQEKDHSLDTLGFFDHIDKKKPTIIKLFWYLFLRRNIYVSPFMVSSTMNPRWKRIICLYIYILFQIFILTLGLSIAERMDVSDGIKIMLFQLITIFLADMIILIMIPLFRIPTNTKKTLFSCFKSTQQIKLLKIFKDIKEVQKKKFNYILAIIICTFIVTLYLSFNYCSVLYYSRWLFVECLFVGILLDFVLYEGILNGAICLFYFLE